MASKMTIHYHVIFICASKTNAVFQFYNKFIFVNNVKMCDNFGKRQGTATCGPPKKRLKDFGIISTATDANCSGDEVLLEGNERNQPVADFESLYKNADPTPLAYNGKIPLQPEELLLYSLLNVSLSSKSIYSVKSYTAEKFLDVARAVYVVCGVRFDCPSIQNYFYRAINNLTKGLGKYKGRLRWNFYSDCITQIATKHRPLLCCVLTSGLCNQQNYCELKQDLENQCLKCLHESELSETLAYKVTKSLDNISGKFPKWKVLANMHEGNVNLYYMGTSPVIVEYEVIITAEGDWKFILMGNPRIIDVDPTLLPHQIHELSQLFILMKTLENWKVCSGVPSENYQSLLPENVSVPVFKTRDGEPGAFVEYHSVDKQCIIRSTKCKILVHGGNVCCKACFEANHYMRTLKSRRQQSASASSTTSKHKRFDYMSKQELLDHCRESAKTFHSMQTQMKRLEQYQEDMSTVGGQTDSEFRKLFNDLYDGLSKKVEKCNNNTCYWNYCDRSDEFCSKELLMKHIKEFHLSTVDQSDKAPIDRHYNCGWLGCSKEFQKKKLLLNHLEEHIGSESDMFLLTLLKDQAKALNVPSRQMRWHPLVIKWCLRIYSRSHSLYADIRDSGFLKLPSGRTLSDYKNFSTSKSGWQTSVLDAMRNNFKEQGFSNVGKLGGLFFDEVKIKEGLLFDPSSWELVGFVDLENRDSVGTGNIQDSLATHILQFYFKSIFANFQYPCAYFLTKGISGQNLNRTFWQGVGLLQAYGFTTILTCCDGAAENRSFMKMNCIDETVSQTKNPFSDMPLFFISDPPHLMKKLRNNIYNSGCKDISPRYTRYLLLNSKPILWEHIYSVYQRDKNRHLFATDMRSSHVRLDSLSKMRVKLAVQVLNDKVQKDMEAFDPVATESTQLFIHHCNLLWNVLNSNKPLSTTTDSRIKDLDTVMQFFDNWRDELYLLFKTKSEVSSHFISWQTMFDLKVDHCV
jgi:hypothetical protein